MIKRGAIDRGSTVCDFVFFYYFQTEENDSKAERGRKRKKNERKDKTKDAKKQKKQKVAPKSISFNTGEIQQLSVKVCRSTYSQTCIQRLSLGKGKVIV